MYLTKNGVKTHEFAYSTYGELTLGEYGEIRFLYNGQYGVAADGNGLYYMRARYYNPEIRRFINQDILTGSIENSQSLNRYAYCQGNPVNYFDPFGLESCNFFSGLGHTVLNLLGLIPGIGDAFDIVNAGWYIAEGRWDKAFEAGIAAIPIFGNFMPDTGLFRYIKRGLNLVSYGGTGFLAGQGMWEGGQALWEEINSKNCSGWRIAGNIVGIGLNGVSLFLSGKGFISETKTLNKMLKDDGVYEWLNNIKGGNTSKSTPATVEELIEMMNKREGVTARFASGDELDYLMYQNAEASHMLMTDGTSDLIFRKDVSTRWTAFHEWMHHCLQKKNGSYIPGEDDIIEAFLNKYKEFLKIE